MPITDLFSNNRIKSILSSYLKNDIIPHSMIFSGPGSADILSFAKAFSKSLNCLSLKDDFCGICKNCLNIEKGTFPDVKILSPEGQYYKKAQVTYIVEDNFRRPLIGKRKMYILKDSHKLSENSSNAFLKILEEPAASNIFILLTNNLNGLLPTVKSRCQILNFQYPSKPEISKYLIKKGYNQDMVNILSNLSGANIDNLLELDFNSLMQKRSNVFTVLNKLIRKRGVEDVLLDLYSKSGSREKFLDYFRELVNLISLFLRDIIVLKLDKENKHILNIDYKEELVNLSEYITVNKLLFLIEKMEILLRDIKRNLNARVLLLEFIRSYTKREIEDV